MGSNDPSSVWVILAKGAFRRDDFVISENLVVN